MVNKTAGLNDRSLLRIFDIWKESFRILRSERTSPRVTSTNTANFPFGANDRFEASIYRPSLTGLGRELSDSLVQSGHSAAGILWTLSAEVLHHGCDTKHDGGEQNCDDDRRPIGPVRGDETWSDNKERGGKAGHCQPLLENAR